MKVKTLKNKLHTLWSLAVRKRDDYTCQWCGRQDKRNHAHHIVSKGSGCGNFATYDIRNGICLCYRCHIFKIEDCPVEFSQFITDWLNKKEIDYYELKLGYALMVTKFDEEFYNRQKEALENYINALP